MAAITDYTDDFGRRLCKVLGLDPKKTADIIIENKVNDVVIVRTRQYLQDDEVEGLLELFVDYELHRKEDNEEQLGDKVAAK